MPTVEKEATFSGRTYGRSRDICYRAGLAVQTLGAAVTAVLYPLANPFYTIGIMLFESGVLLSASYLLVRMRSVKMLVLGSVLTGLALQIGGSFFTPEQYAGSAIIAGLGLVCVGAGGMVGKEAYCFSYWEGWVLMLIGYPVMVLVNLFGRENRVFNSLGFSAVFLLLLSLTGKKMRQQPPTQYGTDVCGTPDRSQQ